MVKRVLLPLGLGIVATMVLLGLAFEADSAGLDTLARALSWQNTLLQSFIPMGNIGTPERPVYEGSSLNLLAFFASVPLGVLIYGTTAFVLLHRTRRRR